jgi:hypothetical protein
MARETLPRWQKRVSRGYRKSVQLVACQKHERRRKKFHAKCVDEVGASPGLSSTYGVLLEALNLS